MKPLQAIIRSEIEAQGTLSFERFMELALYHPTFGYYEQSSGVTGKAGDFYTSLSSGKLFGELLACRFGCWLGEFREGPVQLVEGGAHDGQLAKDIFQWMDRKRPALLDRLEYWFIEPSAHRRQWQSQKLAPFLARCRWFSSWEEVPAESVTGIIFSNELLDAMPFRRFGWNAASATWFEWGVQWNSDRFVWAKISLTNPLFPMLRSAGMDHLQSLLDVLPDDFTLEISPAAAAWWGEAAHSLRSGWLLACDYGSTAEELTDPKRTRGTLRAFYKHRFASDPLSRPGEQDLTAHVNFTQLQRCGEAEGLCSDTFCTQAQFLTSILKERIRHKDQPVWSEREVRQFQTLTHPDHLGRVFRVLVQRREFP